MKRRGSESIGEDWRGLERKMRGSEGIREDRRIKGEKKERIEIFLGGSERKMRGSERIGEDQI